MGVRTNLPQYVERVKAAAPRREVHTLRITNIAEYAKYLEDRYGYWVVSGVLESGVGHAIVIGWMRELLQEHGAAVTDEMIEQALEAAGYEIVNWLQSLTTEIRPPVRANEGPRQAHPGHWADVTGMLAGSYRFQVNGGQMRLVQYTGGAISGRRAA